MRYQDVCHRGGMSKRETSRDAYLYIKENGLLSRTRFKVYEWLYEHGPATARECFADTGLETHHSPRFNELEDLGVVSRTGTRVCRVTGFNAIEWGITDKLPHDKQGHKRKPKRLSKKEMNSALGELRELFKMGRDEGRPDNMALVTLGS